jgi:hypothetical protein
VRKRTDAIERHVDHARTPQGRAEPGVFIIPRKLDLDTWERLAVPAQELLIRNVRNDSEDQ